MTVFVEDGHDFWCQDVAEDNRLTEMLAPVDKTNN